MSLWSFAGVHGAPGVTTLALAAMTGWGGSRPRLLVEADPAGGVLAARFDERLRLDRTLADLAAGVRDGWTDRTIEQCAREVWPGHPVVVAAPSPELVTGTLRSRGDQIASALAGAPVDVFADLGRLQVESPAMALARRSVVTVIVTRDRLEDLSLVTPTARSLRAAGLALGLVVIRSHRHVIASPVGVAQFEDAAGAPVMGVLPWAPRPAGVFSGNANTGRWAQSTWWRAIRALTAHLAGLDPLHPALTHRPAPPPARSSVASNGVGHAR
jgi:hypothetical protein